MGLRYKSRVPKRRRDKDLEVAIGMIVYPIAILGALLFGKRKRK